MCVCVFNTVFTFDKPGFGFWTLKREPSCVWRRRFAASWRSAEQTLWVIVWLQLPLWGCQYRRS